MELQQLIEWFGGLAGLIWFGWMVIKKIWAKLEEKDTKLEAKDTLIKSIVEKHAENIEKITAKNELALNNVVETNNEQIKMRDEEWFHQFKKFTELVSETRQQNKIDREEGRQVLKEHNGLMMGIKEATIQINSIVQQTSNNVQVLLNRKE